MTKRGNKKLFRRLAHFVLTLFYSYVNTKLST